MSMALVGKAGVDRGLDDGSAVGQQPARYMDTPLNQIDVPRCADFSHEPAEQLEAAGPGEFYQLRQSYR